MIYYKIIGYGGCEWCQRANSLMESLKLPFIACWIENSPELLNWYKTTYGMETVPIVLKIDTESEFVDVIGGFTEFEKYSKQELYQEGDKKSE